MPSSSPPRGLCTCVPSTLWNVVLPQTFPCLVPYDQVFHIIYLTTLTPPASYCTPPHTHTHTLPYCSIFYTVLSFPDIITYLLFLSVCLSHHIVGSMRTGILPVLSTAVSSDSRQLSTAQHSQCVQSSKFKTKHDQQRRRKRLILANRGSIWRGNI